MHFLELNLNRCDVTFFQMSACGTLKLVFYCISIMADDLLKNQTYIDVTRHVFQISACGTLKSVFYCIAIMGDDLLTNQTYIDVTSRFSNTNMRSPLNLYIIHHTKDIEIA